MDHIVDKLTEIETAAMAIVSHASDEKSGYEEQIKEEERIFDEKTKKQTKEKLNALDIELKRRIEQEGEALKEASVTAIKNYEREYDEFHDLYAKQILNRIIEV